MEEIHRRVIRDLYDFLAKNLQLRELLTQLRIDDTITEDMHDQILAEKTNLDKNVMFLSCIQKRGPTAFDKLMNALNGSRQSHIADKLQEKLTSLRQPLG
ncbi:hypothetical protein ACJMK2_015911 [Sinanodonta woodiana]|uniref:CARD domain-containing protein n=1 Tax=Sinanodonta woodiana TaxID=1069815 RepID=A0ABD3UVN9_SINWO